jgi:hypothetical protein
VEEHRRAIDLTPPEESAQRAFALNDLGVALKFLALQGEEQTKNLRAAVDNLI